MNKVVIIGIDGMDSILLEKFKIDMPNLSKIISQSPKMKMRSIFPPDSLPAWASIYTGLTPAQHGIINFVNPTDRESTAKLHTSEDIHIKGKTFWDLASKFGKRSCIVLPFNIFPGWEINGAMVCRINIDAPKNYPLVFHPNSIKEKYPVVYEDINQIEGMFSTRWLKELIDICKRRTEAEAQLSLKMMQNEKWDLFYTIFTALDAIQHYFWIFYDESHPDYIKDNPYKSVIRDFYLLIDDVLGRFLQFIGDNISLIVLSDHGLGLRPTKIVNINKILCEKGYLVSKNVPMKKMTVSNKRLIRKGITKLVNIFGLSPSQMRFLKKFPIWKRLLASPLKIDWDRTTAYVTDLSTIKSYSYGGIRINREVYKGDYNKLINKLIEELREIKNPETSENLMKFICKREDLYKGEYIDKYPEILIELKYGYGLGWEVDGPLIETGSMHKIYPGSHMMDTPVFFMNCTDQNIRFIKEEISLMDIAPTILHLVGISEQLNFAGKSLVEYTK